jgi:hypothetical protein
MEEKLQNVNLRLDVCRHVASHNFVGGKIKSLDPLPAIGQSLE